MSLLTQFYGGGGSGGGGLNIYTYTGTLSQSLPTIDPEGGSLCYGITHGLTITGGKIDYIFETGSSTSSTILAFPTDTTTQTGSNFRSTLRFYSFSGTTLKFTTSSDGIPGQRTSMVVFSYV